MSVVFYTCSYVPSSVVRSCPTQDDVYKHYVYNIYIIRDKPPAPSKTISRTPRALEVYQHAQRTRRLTRARVAARKCLLYNLRTIIRWKCRVRTAEGEVSPLEKHSRSGETGRRSHPMDARIRAGTEKDAEQRTGS